jgi:hypothetical protein
VENFVSQNPDPVLRIGKDGIVDSSNRTGELLLHEWGIKVGDKVPSFIENFAKRVISQNNSEKTEVKVKKRVYLLSFYPLPKEEQVDVYGFDVTDQKKLKEKLRIKEARNDALYRMGTLALRCESLQAFMDQSVKLIAKTLDLEFWNFNLMETFYSGQEWAGSQDLWEKPLFLGVKIPRQDIRCFQRYR